MAGDDVSNALGAPPIAAKNHFPGKSPGGTHFVCPIYANVLEPGSRGFEFIRGDTRSQDQELLLCVFLRLMTDISNCPICRDQCKEANTSALVAELEAARQFENADALGLSDEDDDGFIQLDDDVDQGIIRFNPESAELEQKEVLAQFLEAGEGSAVARRRVREAVIMHMERVPSSNDGTVTALFRLHAFVFCDHVNIDERHEQLFTRQYYQHFMKMRVDRSGDDEKAAVVHDTEQMATKQAVTKARLTTPSGQCLHGLDKAKWRLVLIQAGLYSSSAEESQFLAHSQFTASNPLSVTNCFDFARVVKVCPSSSVLCDSGADAKSVQGALPCVAAFHDPNSYADHAYPDSKSVLVYPRSVWQMCSFFRFRRPDSLGIIRDLQQYMDDDTETIAKMETDGAFPRDASVQDRLETYVMVHNPLFNNKARTLESLAAENKSERIELTREQLRTRSLSGEERRAAETRLEQRSRETDGRQAGRLARCILNGRDISGQSKSSQAAFWHVMATASKAGEAGAFLLLSKTSLNRTIGGDWLGMLARNLEMHMGVHDNLDFLLTMVVASLAANHPERGEKLNILQTGKFSTGKSFRNKIVEMLRLDDSSSNMSYETSKSMVVSGNTDGDASFYDEVPQSLISVPGAQTTTDASNRFKESLSSGMFESHVLVLNDDGTRSLVHYKNYLDGVRMGNTNARKKEIQSAILSRFLVLPCLIAQRTQTTVHQQRARVENNTTKLLRDAFVGDMHWMHSMVYTVQTMMRAGVLPRPSIKCTKQMLTDLVAVLPDFKEDARTGNRVAVVASTLTIISAIIRMYRSVTSPLCPDSLLPADLMAAVDSEYRRRHPEEDMTWTTRIPAGASEPFSLAQLVRIVPYLQDSTDIAVQTMGLMRHEFTNVLYYYVLKAMRECLSERTKQRMTILGVGLTDSIHDCDIDAILSARQGRESTATRDLMETTRRDWIAERNALCLCDEQDNDAVRFGVLTDDLVQSTKTVELPMLDSRQMRRRALDGSSIPAFESNSFRPLADCAEGGVDTNRQQTRVKVDTARVQLNIKLLGSDAQRVFLVASALKPHLPPEVAHCDIKDIVKDLVRATRTTTHTDATGRLRKSRIPILAVGGRCPTIDRQTLQEATPYPIRALIEAFTSHRAVPAIDSPIASVDPELPQFLRNVQLRPDYSKVRSVKRPDFYVTEEVADVCRALNVEPIDAKTVFSKSSEERLDEQIEETQRRQFLKDQRMSEAAAIVRGAFPFEESIRLELALSGAEGRASSRHRFDTEGLVRPGLIAPANLEEHMELLLLWYGGRLVYRKMFVYPHFASTAEPVDAEPAIRTRWNANIASDALAHCPLDILQRVLREKTNLDIGACESSEYLERILRREERT